MEQEEEVTGAGAGEVEGGMAVVDGDMVEGDTMEGNMVEGARAALDSVEGAGGVVEGDNVEVS